ncbi:MAG: hypothetical protein M2R46_05327 [Verrucomicrobia subdivision 3 bacterium]|nr:hypothetical protein [Limisphaerales bacterium]
MPVKCNYGKYKSKYAAYKVAGRTLTVEATEVKAEVVQKPRVMSSDERFLHRLDDIIDNNDADDFVKIQAIKKYREIEKERGKEVKQTVDERGYDDNASRSSSIFVPLLVLTLILLIIAGCTAKQGDLNYTA